MSRSNTGTDESKITTDREMIRGWVGDHDAIPVRYGGVEGESGTLHIVPEAEVDDSHRELTWDDFFEEFEREERVVVYHGPDSPEPFEVMDRSHAIGRATVEDEAVEEALAEGDTVRSELQETTVVERTIVEEATVESEVTGREVISEEVVDAELLTRDVVECEITDGDVASPGVEPEAGFEVGERTTVADGLGVEVLVDEGWSVTKEVIERLTVESRVVDTDATETETVESDTVERRVDVEGVQQQVVESDLVDTDASGSTTVEAGTVESEFAEGDVVRTRLVERKTVDEEVSLRRRLAGEITEGETIEVDTVRREVVESEIVDEGEAAGEPGGAGVGGVSAGEVGDEVVTPSDDDEGKTVVDANGEEVGMVVDVREDTLYVDPHPSLTDRIRTALGWGESDDDDYPVGPNRIARITDSQVELVSVEPATEEATE